MLEKLKSQFSNLLKNNDELKPQIVGLVIMFVLCILAYSAGRGDGRQDERAQLPDNARIEAKLDKIEGAMMSNQDCAAELLNSARQDAK